VGTPGRGQPARRTRSVVLGSMGWRRRVVPP